MSESYPVIEVTKWSRIRDEVMGSKRKVWLKAPDEQRWLFKYPRLHSGEHWSEKLAADVGRELGIACAEVELALFDGHPGAICRDFTDGGRRGNLVHKNELLLERDPDYPTQQNFKLAKHTSDRIFDILSQDFVRKPESWAALPGIETACDLFVGYLLLDALIGNVDRHHENWAIIEFWTGQNEPRSAELAPSFDHASSMGRELSDTQRVYKMKPGPPDQTLGGYASRAQSKIYASETDPKPMSPLAAFQTAAIRYPVAARIWRERLREIVPDLIKSCGNLMPLDVMSIPARSFVQALSKYNADAIQNLG